MINERILFKVVKKILKELYILKKELEKLHENNKTSKLSSDLKYIYKWISVLEIEQSANAINEVWSEVQNISKIMDGSSSSVELKKKDKLIQRLWRVVFNATIQVRK